MPKLLISLLIILISVSVTSCNKGDEPKPDQVDSIKAVLPKQIIWNQDVLTTVFSVKYDTSNYRIEFYEDDTTNSNPFDRLAITYAYNKDGYLIGFDTDIPGFWGSIFDNGSATIKRDADNKIIYIAYDDRDFNEKDTSFYNYESVNGGTNISSIGGYNGYFEGTTVYNYDADYKLLAYSSDMGQSTATFSYNSNNSVQQIISHGFVDNQSEFSYTSGIPDEQADRFYELLLGKDYYLWDLSDFFPFSFYLDPDYDNYLISATNQFHVTKMKDTHQPDGGSGVEEATINYELNEDGLLSHAIFKIDGELEGDIKLKY
jgi:hypothetical protein